jgi:predicted MPP superfamily phosphohydrolase
MNNVLIRPAEHRRSKRAFLKKLVWSAANSCALGGLFTGRLEKHWLRLERRPMPLPHLGEGFRGATLAHVSDLHCSPIVRERYLRQCVEAINAVQADFVAITGDFITGPRSYARRIARILKELAPKTAVLACLGNHDYGIFHPHGRGGKHELAETLYDALGHADIFVMRNERRVFHRKGESLQFIGVEDFWSSSYDPKLAFDMAHPHLPTIALCHNPDAALDLACHGADWVLAGHTHGTGISNRRLAALFFPTIHKRFTAGQYSLGDGKYLYVNRGLSYGRRHNLNGRPEITLFTLTSA